MFVFAMLVETALIGLAKDSQSVVARSQGLRASDAWSMNRGSC